MSFDTFSVLGTEYRLTSGQTGELSEAWQVEVLDGRGRVLYSLTVDMDTIAEAQASAIPHLFTREALEQQVRDSFVKFVTEVVPQIQARTEADKSGAV